MRGKGMPYYTFTGVFGITPAYAGKRQVTFSTIRQTRDHPRLCGEKESWLPSLSAPRGSPPPMRGKVFLVPSILAVQRITPAYAGKRAVGKSRRNPSRDHPRLCGEKVNSRLSVSKEVGSPPPMRGKDWDNEDHRTKAGITPAYAGKSVPFRTIL